MTYALQNKNSYKIWNILSKKLIKIEWNQLVALFKVFLKWQYMIIKSKGVREIIFLKGNSCNKQKWIAKRKNYIQ